MSISLRKKRLLSLFVLLTLAVSLFAGSASASEVTDTVLTKVLMTTSKEPVVYVAVSDITASCSKPGYTIDSFGYFDETGAAATGDFTEQRYTVRIELSAAPGYVFDEAVQAYLNNSPIDVTWNSSTSLTLSRTVTPAVWAPTVVNHPSPASVNAGEKATFLASAIYCKSLKWMFLSPDGKTKLTCDDAVKQFEGLRVTKDSDERIQLSDIPASMNGWKIYCVFTGAAKSSAETMGAKITVKDAPEPTPEPEEAPAEPEAPTEEAPAEPEAPAEEEQPAEEEVPAEPEHVHDFGTNYFSDEVGHWRTCECGETTTTESHSYVWRTITAVSRKAPGVEEGTCSTCGYVTTRTVESAAGSKDVLQQLPVVPILLGIGALLVVLIVAQSVSDARRRKHRRKKR